jgi:hypothetical protein
MIQQWPVPSHKAANSFYNLSRITTPSQEYRLAFPFPLPDHTWSKIRIRRRTASVIKWVKGELSLSLVNIRKPFKSLFPFPTYYVQDLGRPSSLNKIPFALNATPTSSLMLQPAKGYNFSIIQTSS